MRSRISFVRSLVGIAATGALVAAGLVGTGLVGSSAAVADPTAPSSVTLSTSSSIIAAGDSATLTALTDLPVDDTGESVQITDQTTSTVLASCSTGSECTATTAFDTGAAHTYVATVGDLTSSTVSVEREAWTLHLASSSHTVKAGDSTNVVARANQDVGATDGNYEIDIFDMETGVRIAQCTTGTSCTAPSTLMYDDDSFSHNYDAVVAAVGGPESATDATDIQASAGPVTVSDASWQLTMTTNRDVVAVGQTVTVTLHANQNVAYTNGQLELYIFDPENDAFLARRYEYELDLLRLGPPFE
jgi:hypothetical protein